MSHTERKRKVQMQSSSCDKLTMPRRKNIHQYAMEQESNSKERLRFRIHGRKKERAGNTNSKHHQMETGKIENVAHTISTGHTSLEGMIDNACGKEDGSFIEARRKHAIVCIPTPQGERLYLNPGQGGLQGDSAMAA